MAARALGLLAGYVADRRWGDPARRHPVAGFGAIGAQLERRVYADDRPAGALLTGMLVGGAALAGIVAERLTRRCPVLQFLTTAASTWTVLGGRSLEAEAVAVREHLDADDLPAARQQLTHLVGRDTDQLDASDVSRAVIESVAENTSDAVVAPLFFGAIGGIPGLLAYRAANTLDAMVGHRNARYANFGWASARLDDLLNWIPARLGAILAAWLAPTIGGSTAAARRTWLRDASAHPSPNAGQIEAAFAGALGVQLGGVNAYGGQIEDRHVLGDGPPPQPGDIDAANHLSLLVGATTAVLAAATAAMVSRRRRP